MNELDSRAKIIQAAIRVFAEKGQYGAKMEEIATKAEINKAMLYYYYSTKENLYRETLHNVISDYLARIFNMVEQIMNDHSDPVETLKKIIAVYFDVFSADKTYTKLILDAIASEPEELEQIMFSVKRNQPLDVPERFLILLQTGMEQGVFRKVDPKHLLLNVISMTMFYFFGKPAVKVMLDLQIEDERQFLKGRQAAVVDLLLFGILEKK